MKEKILAFLKTKLAGFAGGVEEGFLLEYADHFSKSITDETQIATTLTDGAIDNIKLAYGFYNKEVVKKTTEAQKTALKNWQEKHGLNEDGTLIKKENKKKEDKADPDEPAWFKEYREKVDAKHAELESKLVAQEQEKLQSKQIGNVTAKLKEKGIPESYYKGRNLIPKSEAEIDQLVIGVETDWNEFKQFQAEQGTIISIPPAAGSTVKEGEALGKSIAEKKNANSSDGVQGKELTTKK